MATCLTSAPQRDSLLDLIAAADYRAIADLAARDRLVLTRLLGLTFSADDLTGWRAAWALGRAAALVAERDAEFVRNVLRRLVWSLNDESGSVGWRSPQAMGAIIAASPGRFPEFVPLVLSLLELEERTFLPGTLWAVAQLADSGVPGLDGAAALVRPYLAAPEPAVRGMAARCAGALGDGEATAALVGLLGDQATLTVFDGRDLVAATVGAEAERSLSKLRRR